ncbi:MAG: hypothetical protein IJZ08_00990 [Clostridia bacterium]|nr:hypothetical protein [Clostridia bacterium]
MKEIVYHSIYGEIVYTENIWTGKKHLTANGADVPAVSKKEFLLGGEKAIVKGSMFLGISLCLPNETIQISPKTKWYEIVLSGLPLAFLMAWGNSPALCAVFPVVGGAIGGALGGLLSSWSLLLIKKIESIALKILTGIGMTVLTMLCGFVIALLLLLIRF